MSTQSISLRERIYTAIAHQSLLVSGGIYSLCELGVDDLRWLYEQIGEAYIQDMKRGEIDQTAELLHMEEK